MLFRWLRNRRRRQLVAEPFPRAWDEFLASNAHLAARLPHALQRKLRDRLRVFIAERTWVGCGGLEMTDEIRVTVAAQACVLLLGVEGYYFDNLKSVLVYPDAFVRPPEFQGHGGVVDEEQSASGEAWYGGPVILSWEHVLRGGREDDDGCNVVYHEFAHQLDGLDGEMGGMPPLGSEGQARRWTEVVDDEFQRLLGKVKRGSATLLDHYGASNHAEFFAVATECFFEKSRQLRDRHPSLYAVLQDYYHQDPAARS